jgi:hypothetical protein
LELKLEHSRKKSNKISKVTKNSGKDFVTLARKRIALKKRFRGM